MCLRSRTSWLVGLPIGYEIMDVVRSAPQLLTTTRPFFTRSLNWEQTGLPTSSPCSPPVDSPPLHSIPSGWCLWCRLGFLAKSVGMCFCYISKRLTRYGPIPSSAKFLIRRFINDVVQVLGHSFIGKHCLGNHLRLSNPPRATRPRIQVPPTAMLYAPSPIRLHHSGSPIL